MEKIYIVDYSRVITAIVLKETEKTIVTENNDNYKTVYRKDNLGKEFFWDYESCLAQVKSILTRKLWFIKDDLVRHESLIANLK